MSTTQSWQPPPRTVELLNRLLPGLHAVHVLVGVGALSVLFSWIAKAKVTAERPIPFFSSHATILFLNSAVGSPSNSPELTAIPSAVSAGSPSSWGSRRPPEVPMRPSTPR